jgi:WD40 repeat protein
MSLDFAQKFVATVGQDRYLRIYDIASGADLHYYKATPNEGGSVNKIAIDSSGMFVATSTADKRLRLHNFYTG